MGRRRFEFSRTFGRSLIAATEPREWLLRRQNSILGDPGAVSRVGKKGGESLRERECRNSYMGKRLV